MCIKKTFLASSVVPLFFFFGLLRVCGFLTDLNSSPIGAVGQNESGFTRFLVFSGIDGLFVRFDGCSE